MKTMTKPNNVRLAAAIASLLLVATLIIRTTEAAFTDTTTNSGNNFAAGDLEIVDYDNGSPLFNTAPVASTITVDSSGMVPADPRSNCLHVEYLGDVAATVDLYATGAAGGTGLADYMDITVEEFASVDCTGTSVGATPLKTLAAFTTAYTSTTGWTAGWTPSTSGEDRSFKVTVEVQDNDAAQGLTADAVELVWRASS